jgi:DNA polymerase III delta subunit
VDRGAFPATVYLEGPSEPLKAALLAEVRAAWAASCPESPLARVLRAAESGVPEILAAFQGVSLFSPRDLIVVLEIEDFGRSEKRIAALATGLARPVGTSSLILVESSAENPRKALEPLRAACQFHVVAMPPTRAELERWGARRLGREGFTSEPGVIDSLIEACEGDALAFFSELDKLCAWASRDGRIRAEDVAALLRPTVGADLPDFIAAVAAGHAGIASRSLGRLLAAGVGEGTLLFSLANLVGGALGGWARYRECSETLRRRSGPAGLRRALDAVYRAESAWKGGRADVVAVLEQATRELCGAA